MNPIAAPIAIQWTGFTDTTPAQFGIAGSPNRGKQQIAYHTLAANEQTAKRPP
jgi:hypothetical protein